MGPWEGGSTHSDLAPRVRRRHSSFNLDCTTPSTMMSGGVSSLFQTTSTQELSVFSCISASLERACCKVISSCRFFIFESFVWSTGESILGFCKLLFSYFFILETCCLRSITFEWSCLFSISRDSILRSRYLTKMYSMKSPAPWRYPRGWRFVPRCCYNWWGSILVP
jgi:hypothetical protein